MSKKDLFDDRFILMSQQDVPHPKISRKFSPFSYSIENPN